MAAFGALAAAFDGPGLRCTGAVVAARTHQTLHAGLSHIRAELDAGGQRTACHVHCALRRLCSFSIACVLTQPAGNAAAWNGPTRHRNLSPDQLFVLHPEHARVRCKEEKRKSTEASSRAPPVYGFIPLDSQLADSLSEITL